MATRLKTIEYAHPPLATMSNNTMSSLAQITVYIPETVVGFTSVIARMSAMVTQATIGNITSRQMQARLGAAAYSNYTNNALITQSGEDIFFFNALDLTAHFTANWSGTSMTFDTQVLMNGATATSWDNVCVSLFITYQYDDTSTTQVKTIRIPLDMPVGAADTSKPGAALATIPNLSSELPEASKSFRNWFVTVQGNVNRSTNSTDLTWTFQLDSTTAHTSGAFIGAQQTDFFYRYLWDAPNLDVNSSMGWYAWSNLARMNHTQAWLTVTYEFDASSSNDMFVSLFLPMEMVSPMGGTSSADYQRAKRELWIQEPGTITTKQIAFFAFWDQAAAIAGLNLRIGTGSWVTYVDLANTNAGGNAAMIRNDSAFTLVKGRNTFNFDAYRTDAADMGDNVSGFWIINYTCGKPTDGYGAANNSVWQNMGAYFNGAVAAMRTTSALAFAIPESKYFINAVGINYEYFSNSTNNMAGVTIAAERLVGEGGMSWDPAYISVSRTDPEVGLRQCFAQVRSLFLRWPGDPDPDRIDIESARRWRAYLANNAASWDYLDLIVTYHTISYVVAGTISNSGGGTVNIELHRTAEGEKIVETSRSGDGAYSMDWYDDTEDVYVTAYEDSTHRGRSDNDTAS